MRWVFVLALALAGCAGGEYDRIYGGGAGLPAVATRSNTADVVPPGRGRLGLAVRTFVADPAADRGWREVTGARCRITGGDFYRAELVTPARLVVPDLGPDAPVLVADCATGTASGRAAVAPGYGWRNPGVPSAGNRVWWGGGWWWGMQRTGPMRYPDLAVALRQE
jgi:hypothetical protein